MNKLHKHAALIKAWADGAEIQEKSVDHGAWVSVNYPVWYNSMEYRIKPKTIRYRTYLYFSYGKYTIAVVYTTSEASNCSSHTSFVKWLGDWVEVEV